MSSSGDQSGDQPVPGKGVRQGQKQTRSGKARLWRSPWAICLPVFLGCLFLYTRHNDFPLNRQCHYDEPRKVRSILEGYQNFNHPLLMLMGTRVARRLTGRTDDPHRIVVLGRTVTAVFAALAVTALTYLAFLEAGRLAALCVGTITGLLPLLLRLAHFMKEDPALLFGLCCFLLAAALYLRRRSWQNLLLMAAACGLAASGKYVGVAAFLVGLPLVVVLAGEGGGNRATRVLAFVCASFAVFAVIDFPWFLDLREGLRDAQGEALHALEGHAGMRPNRLTVPYAGVLRRETIPPVLILALGFVAATAWRWRTRSGSDRLVVLFAGGYFVLLSLSPLQMSRYLLPVVVLVCYMAGRALAWGISAVPRRPPVRVGAAILCLAVVLGWEGVLCRGDLHRFGSSVLPDLAGWIRTHLPPGSVVAQDAFVDLPDRIALNAGGASIEVVGHSVMVADRLHTLDQARERGVTHIAVCWRAYDELFSPDLAPAPGQEDVFRRRRQFYDDLFREGQLLWHYVPPPDSMFSEMRLYRLPDSGR